MRFSPFSEVIARNVDVHLYKFFSARCYITVAVIVNVCMGSPKWLAMNKFVHTKSHTGSKFSKISLRLMCT